MESDDGFESFSQAIATDPIGVLLAKWRREVFIRKLKQLPDVVDVIPSGSLASSSQIGPVHDADLIVVFDSAKHPDYGVKGRSKEAEESAQAAMTHLEGKLLEQLHLLPGAVGASVRETEQRAHMVRYNGDWAGPFREFIPVAPPVDVMPAVREGSHLLVPQRGAGWIDFNPEGLIRQVEQRQREWKTLTEVMRAVKAWARLNRLEMKSLAVEVMVLQYCPRPRSSESLPSGDAVARFFEAAANAGITSLKDPAGRFGEIDPDLNYQRLRSALSDAAALARHAMDADRARENHQYPIVAQLALDEPARRDRMGLIRRRENTEIPRLRPHEVLVWRVGGRYLADTRELRARDDVIVRASSVSVVSVRPATEVEVSFQVVSRDNSEFTVKVTFTCSVLDPVTVVRGGQVSAADALLAYLRAYPDLFQIGLKFSVAEINKIRTAMASHVKAYIALYPPRIPGIKIGTATVQVDTPASLGKIQEINQEQQIELAADKQRAYIDEMAKNAREYAAQDRDAVWEREDRREQVKANIELLMGYADRGYLDIANADIENIIRRIQGDAGGHGRDVPAFSPDSQPGRYLKGQCPDSVRVGEPFSVLVSIVREGTGGGALLKAFPVGPGGVDIFLVLHAPGLQVLSGQRRVVRVPADGDSEPVMFELKAGSPGPCQISITAWLSGTFLGNLIVETTADRDHASGDRHRDFLATVDTAAVDGAVSLVVRYDPAQNAYRFEFRDEDNPDEVPSQLAYEPGPRVERLVAELDRLTKGRANFTASETRDYLREAGIGLWSELLPEQLRRQFWERQHRITQLTILADTDTVPWELLYPLDPGCDAGFLVEQFPVTRMVFRHRPSRSLSLSPPWFVLPGGSPSRARDEVNELLRLLGGQQPSGPQPVIGSLTPLLELIRAGDFGLLHFACHNAFDPSGGSAISLDNRQFTPTHMNSAAVGKVLERSMPTVFMNACRSAGASPSYHQLDGWANKFIEAGAGAFIGTLWAVRDSTAREFAGELYLNLKQGVPLGKAVMQARVAAASEPGDPTWLAYAVYGDPRATLR
jgi:hypothetical protein